MTKTAYLRVYTPARPVTEQRVPGFVKTFGILSESELDTDRVVEWEGIQVSCPSLLLLRVLESTVAFANAFQGVGVGLIPEAAAEAADRELRTYRAEHPDHRSQVLTSAWHVPVRWFIGFSPDSRTVYGDSSSPRIRYREGIGAMRSRLAEASEVLVRVGMIQGPAAEIEQLLGWLSPFPENSMVELDFGDVSELFAPEDLVLDDSVALIRESVEALASGDLVRAGELYGTVVSRWSHAYAVTFSS